MAIPQNRDGFSLLEILIYTVITVSVVGSAVAVLHSTQSFYEVASNQANLFNRVGLAILQIEEMLNVYYAGKIEVHPGGKGLTFREILRWDSLYNRPVFSDYQYHIRWRESKGELLLRKTEKREKRGNESQWIVLCKGVREFKVKLLKRDHHPERLHLLLKVSSGDGQRKNTVIFRREFDLREERLFKGKPRKE